MLPAVEQVGDAPAVYHYAPKEHALERRAILDAKAWGELSAPPTDGAFLVGLSSVHWREAWKYGERAFRYCQHDTGHALATLRIAAAALGWGLVLVNGNGDGAIAISWASGARTTTGRRSARSLSCSHGSPRALRPLRPGCSRG